MRTSERRQKMDSKATKYDAPRIEDHGDLAELTAGTKHGSVTDATLPTGTTLEEVLENLTTP
jgi:hypothetical protein